MANSIIMPKTGMAMETGVLSEWKVKEGDRIRKGDVVAVIETDKSAMELESDYDGVILALLCGEGDTVPVTVPIAWIGEEGETIPVTAVQAAGVDIQNQASPEITVPHPVTSAAGNKVKATPAARRLAKEKGIDISDISPGGKYGEVRAKDLENTAWSYAAPSVRHEAEDTEVPLSRVQQITGKRLQESRQIIPDVVLHIQADVTKLLAMRKEINEQPGIKITINDFVLAAAVKALTVNPRLNSVFNGDRLIYKANINLGVAVATEKGLLVPVIKRAQTMSFREISARAAELADRARTGRLAGNDLEGGTFTVSNMGMYGITMFTPIINPPEAAILGVCAIEEVLKLENEKPVNHSVMGLSLSFDHRIADGAEAAAFLKTLKGLLETPFLMLI